ncbi:peptide deformylase [Streptomyces violaceusniger]|uniref:Peptide deformylase n=1 Tax=Streptomyces violaceusniger (strain Tu 4113) TaxID=653045 RepID=G2P7A3_STRV4|nr:peptide deformylase [Streptomyces violaceusniger]AEM87063.1 transcriptional regulator, XRE family [Streptomyces violaceusniger Tu 4113]
MPTDQHPAEGFIAELKRWRDVRGVSQSALAKPVGYTPSYVSKVESGQQRPSAAFADAADTALRAGGAIRRAFADLETHHRRDPVTHHQPADGSAGEPHAANLTVEHEDTSLYYDGHTYRATQRRRLYNDSPDPVTRYLVRVSVDRYPGNPERSNQHYRENPLTWEEINLSASVSGEPIGWRVQHDRDAFKELWLLFENEHGRYPLYPGESVWLEYSYTVGDDKWGSWFQRAVRLPTQRLSVRLDFPAALDPVVWGTETTMTAAALPFRTAIRQTEEDGRRVFAWSTEDPPLHARYRLEWKFRNDPRTKETKQAMTATASERMRDIGMVQEGDPILTKTARPFALPDEAEDARRVVAELISAAERAATVHVFGKGMGVAAPQIGIDRAAAIVRTPEGETLTLLNPRIVEESPEADEQYEGCLSFFDVRGKVPRPLAISVEHQDIDGQQRITIFERGMARLVAHEVDHLHGLLYRARMREGVDPIPVSEYRGTGSSWQYNGG